MKFLHSVAFLMAAFLIAGCGDKESAQVNKPAPAAVGQKPAAPVAPKAEVKPAVPARTMAKVVMVKPDPKDNFVVIEFLSTEIPAAGSQLSLYRGKERVATVKLTEPMRPPHVTADIVSGQPRVGDEVR